MRFRLRTLMIVLALGPMVLAGGFFYVLPYIPLGISVFGMKVGFCVWLGIVLSAIGLSLFFGAGRSNNAHSPKAKQR